MGLKLDIINEEMHSQKNYNIYTFESSVQKNKRIKSIVVTQLISFSYNMLSFNVSKEKVKDLILSFSKYYEIEEVSVQEIIKNLEEYSYLNEKKEEISDLSHSDKPEKIPDPTDNELVKSQSLQPKDEN